MKSLSIFLFALAILTSSFTGFVFSQELVKAPKELVRYKLSQPRVENGIFGEVIAFDYERTREGQGSAHLIARTDQGRLELIGLAPIKKSGTLRLKKQIPGIARILRRGESGIEFYFVADSFGSYVHSPYVVGGNDKEFLISNIVKHGKMRSTATVRDMNQAEIAQYEKDKKASLPPEEIPDGYTRSNKQTNLIPGCKVLIGYRGEWKPAMVISVKRGRVKALREGANYCQNVSLQNWLAISDETLKKIQDDPSSISPPNLVLNNGNVVLEDDMVPLTDAMGLLKGTPLLKDAFSRWEDVYFLSSDNIKVRVVSNRLGKPNVEFIPIEKMAIRTKSLEDQTKDAAKNSFAANVKEYENSIASGLAGSSSTPIVKSMTGSNPTGSLDSSQSGLAEFPTDEKAEPTSTDDRSSDNFPIRTWSDDKGKFEIDARYSKTENALVFLIRADGKEVRIPMNKLSAADLAYLDDLKQPKTESNNPFVVVEAQGSDEQTNRSVTKRGGGLPDYRLPFKNEMQFGDLGWGAQSVAISPDDRYLVIGRSGSEVTFCDLKDRRVLRNSGRMEHLGNVTAVGFTPDGNRLVICGARGVVEIYSVGNKGNLKLENQFAPHTQEIGTISFSSDGKYALTGSQDKEARYWEVESGRQLVTLDGFKGKVKATCIRPADNLLLATDGAVLKVFDPQVDKLVKRVEISKSAFGQSAAFSHNGFVLAADKSYDIRLWNLLNYQEMPTIKGTSIPWSIRFTPDSRHLISGHNGTINVWDAKKQQRVMSHSVGESHYVKALCSNATGTLFACSSGFKEVTVVRAKAKK